MGSIKYLHEYDCAPPVSAACVTAWHLGAICGRKGGSTAKMHNAWVKDVCPESSYLQFSMTGKNNWQQAQQAQHEEAKWDLFGPICDLFGAYLLQCSCYTLACKAVTLPAVCRGARPTCRSDRPTSPNSRGCLEAEDFSATSLDFLQVERSVVQLGMRTCSLVIMIVIHIAS